MSLYVDASAKLKLYVDEPESASCEAIMGADPQWLTARHTEVEVVRNPSRLLYECLLDSSRRQFTVAGIGAT